MIRQMTNTAEAVTPSALHRRKRNHTSGIGHSVPDFPPLDRPLVISDDIRSLIENPVILSEEDLKDPVIKAMANEDFR